MAGTGPTAGFAARRSAGFVAVVALANKLAGIAWAVLTSGQPYDARRGALSKA